MVMVDWIFNKSPLTYVSLYFTILNYNIKQLH